MTTMASFQHGLTSITSPLPSELVTHIIYQLFFTRSSSSFSFTVYLCLLHTFFVVSILHTYLPYARPSSWSAGTSHKSNSLGRAYGTSFSQPSYNTFSLLPLHTNTHPSSNYSPFFLFHLSFYPTRFSVEDFSRSHMPPIAYTQSFSLYHPSRCLSYLSSCTGLSGSKLFTRYQSDRSLLSLFQLPQPPLSFGLYEADSIACFMFCSVPIVAPASFTWRQFRVPQSAHRSVFLTLSHPASLL